MKLKAFTRRHSATCCVAEEKMTAEEAGQIIRFYTKNFPERLEKFSNANHTTWFVNEGDVTVTVTVTH